MDTPPTRTASELDLETIRRFNRTDARFPDAVTLQQLVEARVDCHPSRRAVICDRDKTFGEQSLTYVELNEKVNQLAHALRREGVGPGHIVAISMERSLAMIIGILAIVKAGGAYLPVSPDNPPARNDYMLKDGGVTILLVHASTVSKLAFGGRIINLDEAGIYRGPTGNPDVVNTPEDLAYVIYTSGSTGKPKGVMIEHRSVINRLHWFQQAYPIGDDDVVLQKTPFYFDVSVWELFWWALQGAQLCLLMPGGERMPQAIIETVRKHHVTILHFVPSMLNVFLDYLGRDTGIVRNLASIRRLFSSGEPLSPSHVRKFTDIVGSRTGARLTNLYGPTEATVDVTYFDCPPDELLDSIPIGRPIHNTRLYVIGGDRQAAIGEVGELCIAGIGLARGYLNNPALTDEKFVDNPVNPGERIYRTGDLARWRADGNVEYLGREDHQVKIRGLRIELGEIENTIRDYPGVTDCVALVKSYSENVVLIVAYVVCRSELNIESLRGYLKEYLPNYMIPSHFQRIDEVPLTPSGKADRKALPEPVLQGRR
jgi:D-alanine--poly(phosphoribitol) ligase subunit 1